MATPGPTPYCEGMICQVDQVVSLDNPSEAKDRPVLIVFPTAYTPPPYKNLLIAVGITHTPSEAKLKSYRPVQLPDTTRHPNTSSGLNRESWAIPDWIIKPLPPCCIQRQLGIVHQVFVQAVRDLIPYDSEWKKIRGMDCMLPNGTCQHCRA